MICDNPKCQHHVPVPVQGRPDRVLVYGPMLPNGDQQIIVVDRHLYRNRYGETAFYLCGVCHSAVEICRRGAA